jgi:hypothetical protein
VRYGRSSRTLYDSCVFVSYVNVVVDGESFFISMTCTEELLNDKDVDDVVEERKEEIMTLKLMRK